MTRHWLKSAVLIPFLVAGLQGQTRETIFKKLSETPGWSPVGDSTKYDKSNIDLLGWQKPSVLETYGFVGATQSDWKSSTGAARVTLVEMSDSSASYGLFTLQRDLAKGNANSSVGAESFTAANELWFWQANYVVLLKGDRAAVADGARILSASILGDSEKPPVSKHLPAEHLVQGTERYILGPESIEPGAGIDASKVGFEDSAEIATARYNVDGNQARLWMLLYPTQHVAKKYDDTLMGSEDNAGKFKKRLGPLIAIVRGTTNTKTIDAILSQVGYETKITWNERRPDISIRDVILTTFTFIGLALAFVLVAGMSFGGVRVFVKSRFPDRVFDRAQDMEIIQLHIDQSVTRKEVEG